MLFLCGTGYELQPSFLLNKLVSLNCQRWQAKAAAHYFILKQWKRRKNKNLSEGRFQRYDLPFEKTRRCLLHVRRKVESQVCLHQKLPSYQVWLLSEPSLNFWQLVWYEMLPSPHPELLSCFTKRPTSDGDLVPLRYLTKRWWDLLVRLLSFGWLSSLDSASLVSSSQKAHRALMCLLLLKGIQKASKHHICQQFYFLYFNCMY